MRAHRRRVIAAGLVRRMRVSGSSSSGACRCRARCADCVRERSGGRPRQRGRAREEGAARDRQAASQRRQRQAASRSLPQGGEGVRGLEDRREPHAAREVQRQGAERRGRAAAGGGGVVGVQWTQIGPAPLIIDAEQNYQGQGPDAGQVVSIAIDPRNTTDKVIYSAFNDGGVWKTTDGGDTWTPKTDYMPTLSIGALALDPANPSIVYAGTGNLYNNGFFKAVGVYRSIDSGDTWSVTSGSSALNGRASTSSSCRPPTRCSSPRTRACSGRRTRAASSRRSPVGGTTERVHHRPRPRHAEPEHRLRGRLRPGHLRLDGRRADVPGGEQPLGRNAHRRAEPDRPRLHLVRAEHDRERPDDVRRRAVHRSLHAARLHAAEELRRDVQVDRRRSDVVEHHGRRERRRATRRLPVRLRPDDRRRPGRREQGVHRLPGAVVLVGRRRQLLEHQRQRHPLGSPRDRLQPARPSHERRRHDAGLDRHRRRQPLHRRRRRQLRPAERRDRDEPLPRDGHRPRRGQQRLQLRRRAGHRARCATSPRDSGTEWHESVDADGGPMAVDWQDPDNAFGISNGQFIRTTNGGDSWNRPGSGDISCMPMSGAAAVDPNDGQHVYVPTNNGTLNSDGSACSQSQGSAGIFRSMDGGASFAGANFVATPATPRFIATTPTDSNLVWVALSNGKVAVSTNFQATTPTVHAEDGDRSAGGEPDRRSRSIRRTRIASSSSIPGFSGTATGALSKHVFLTTDAGTTLDRHRRHRARRDADGPGHAALLGRDRPADDAALDHRLDRPRRPAHARQRRDVAEARHRAAERQRDLAADRLHRHALAASRGDVRSQRVRADDGDRPAARGQLRPRLRASSPSARRRRASARCSTSARTTCT